MKYDHDIRMVRWLSTQKSHLQPHPIVLPPTDAEDIVHYDAYGYRSYKCPKCGRLSHIPQEVEPYCIECLAECSDERNR